jgi:hypothetical protein
MIEYILMCIAAVAAGISGIIISKNLYGNNVIHGKIKNRYDTYISELENDKKKLTGKLNKMKENVTINPQDFDSENPLGSIGSLIAQFSPMLPKNLQPLLNDPSTMKYVEKLVLENPDKVKDLIAKFVKKPTKGNEEPTPDMESV